MRYQIEDNSKDIKQLYWLYYRIVFGSIKDATGFITSRDGDKVIGAWPFREYKPGKFIFKSLIVHPDYRNQGIGKAIIQHSVELLKETGARFIKVRNRTVPRRIFDDLEFQQVDVEKSSGGKFRVFELELF